MSISSDDLHWDKGNSQVDPRCPLIALIKIGVVKHLFIATYQKCRLFIAEVLDFFLIGILLCVVIN